MRGSRNNVPFRAGQCALACLIIGNLVGCSTLDGALAISPVKPWERGVLAREDMQLVTDGMEQAVDEHIYFSKEASTGGVSISGGGCGCN
jgi:hypothetical protein